MEKNKTLLINKRRNQVVVTTAQQCTPPSEGMSTDNTVGIQIRAMTEAQCLEDDANRELNNNPEQTQGTPNPAMNPTVDLHRTKEEAIKEFVRKQGTIALDWYVPNNTRVGDLITERLPIETARGKILFNCPPLSEYFHTSTFKLDLTTRQVYTYLNPPEDIGVPCQQEKFNLELLAKKLQNNMDTSELCVEELERIPLVKKIAAPADIWRKSNTKSFNIASYGNSMQRFQSS